MPITNALATVAVRNIQSATKWYGQLFRRPPDSNPNPEVSEWRFDGGGGLQVYQLPDRAGTGSFTLAVSDLEEQAAHLQKCGFDAGHRPSGQEVETIMTVDLDGNHIAFALMN